MKLAVSSLIVVLALAPGCSKRETSTKSESVKSAEGPNLSAIDKHGDEILASVDKSEAREWLKSPSRVFFKEDPKQVEQFIEDFYKAGAVQVVIGDVETHEGKDFGGGLLVVLPKDAAARAKLFEVGGRADDAFQNDPVSDKGQKYLYYAFD